MADQRLLDPSRKGPIATLQAVAKCLTLRLDGEEAADWADMRTEE